MAEAAADLVGDDVDAATPLCCALTVAAGA